MVVAAAALFAAENPWDKVKELKSGTELLIVRKGVAKPIEAKFDEARDEAIVVVVKNEQRAIPRDEIERIDARKQGRGMTTETKKTINQPDGTPRVGMGGVPGVPGETISSGVTFNKPGFETVYRKPLHGMAEKPAKKK